MGADNSGNGGTIGKLNWRRIRVIFGLAGGDAVIRAGRYPASSPTLVLPGIPGGLFCIARQVDYPRVHVNFEIIVFPNGSVQRCNLIYPPVVLGGGGFYDSAGTAAA